MMLGQLTDTTTSNSAEQEMGFLLRHPQDIPNADSYLLRQFYDEIAALDQVSQVNAEDTRRLRELRRLFEPHAPSALSPTLPMAPSCASGSTDVTKRPKRFNSAAELTNDSNSDDDNTLYFVPPKRYVFERLRKFKRREKLSQTSPEINAEERAELSQNALRSNSEASASESTSESTTESASERTSESASESTSENASESMGGDESGNALGRAAPTNADSSSNEVSIADAPSLEDKVFETRGINLLAGYDDDDDDHSDSDSLGSFDNGTVRNPEVEELSNLMKSNLEDKAIKKSDNSVNEPLGLSKQPLLSKRCKPFGGSTEPQVVLRKLLTDIQAIEGAFRDVEPAAVAHLSADKAALRKRIKEKRQRFKTTAASDSLTESTHVSSNDKAMSADSRQLDNSHRINSLLENESPDDGGEAHAEDVEKANTMFESPHD